MLRNPVEVMYALHAHHLAAWIEDVWDFETALALEADRQLGRRLPRGNKDPHKLFYRQTARFAQHVRNYRNVFGTENLHVIIYDDFNRDSAQAFRQTCSFLGVNPDLSIDFPVIWSNPGFRSPMLAKLLQHPPRFARAAGRILLPRRLRSPLVGTLGACNSVRAPRPPPPVHVPIRLTHRLG